MMTISSSTQAAHMLVAVVQQTQGGHLDTCVAWLGAATVTTVQFSRQQRQIPERHYEPTVDASKAGILVLTLLHAASAAAAMVRSSCTCASRRAAARSADRRPLSASAQRALIWATSVRRFVICAGHSSSQFQDATRFA